MGCKVVILCSPGRGSTTADPAGEEAFGHGNKKERTESSGVES